MALALYRKYRPTAFAELIGQEHVTEPLRQALSSGRLNHAYLFSGPRGCGKTSAARILARSLNCAQGPTPEPCGQCESCQALRNDGPGSVDVIEIDAASHGGVDDARELRERAFFTPVAGRYKIYIIDEAHMVSSAGFNALLKLVEEPPEYVKFVFATTEPEKVLPTIKSRTHHYPFRLVPPGVLRPYLEQLCATEGVPVEPAVFPLVVRAGGGSVRDSLSVLDQLIAGAGPDGVTYARAAALLGVTDAALLDELCDALAAGDGAALFATIDRVAEAGHDARRFAADLLERLRDLIVLQQVPDAAASGLLDAPADQLDRMSRHAAQLGLATLSRCADIVHDGLVEMRGTASPRLLLELICARMLLPAADESAAGVLQRLEQVERRVDAGADRASAPPAPASAPPAAAESPGTTSPTAADPEPPAPATVPTAPEPPAPGTVPAGPEPAAAGTAPPAGGVIDAAAVRRVWEEIVATIGRRSKRAAAVVREASVRAVEGDTLVLHFQHQVHANMLASAPEPLLDAAQRVLGGSWQVRCESGGDDSGGGGGRRQPPRPASGPSGPAGPESTGGGAADPEAPSGREVSGEERPTPPQPSGPAGSGGADWPEPARPGGVAGSPADGVPAQASAPTAAASAPSAPPGARSGAVGAPGTPAPVDLPTTSSPSPGPAGRAGPGGAPATSQQRALRLLEQSLGAERISEITP